MDSRLGEVSPTRVVQRLQPTFEVTVTLCSMVTLTKTTTTTAVNSWWMLGPQRCRSVLGPINRLAEDGEWHCQLLEGHSGVCCAPDGTTW